MGSGFSKRKKQARVMQDQVLKMQEQIMKAEAEGTAGNGLVTVVLSGDQQMKRIKIKPECVDASDIEGLEDLIKSAYNDAVTKLQQASMGGMAGVGGGLGGLGGLEGLF